ncbi:MAG: hypothetical protein JOZ31_04840 [Verrucomicrobia bacterium]|nr:hypothetical protein [Verrucomicrobiota bacterium]
MSCSPRSHSGSRESAAGSVPGPPKNRDVRTIAAALGVAHLVEGTVQRDANRVRITTELPTGNNGFVLLAEFLKKKFWNTAF